MRKFGKILFFGGLIATIVALALGIGGLVYALSAVTSTVRDSPSGMGEVSTQSPSDATWYVFADSPSFSECVARGPEGDDIEIRRPNGSMTFTVDGRQVHRIAEFTADKAGQYQVECDANSGTIRLVEADKATGGIGWMIAAPFLIVGGIFLGLLTLLGLILWLVGRSREKSAPVTPGPYNQGPPGSPPHNQGPPRQGPPGNLPYQQGPPA
ncbi:hypothetical protein [Enemella sp. A6]|uniref:hypothetical protein n=1 Tax=Enemella sp. A6 TaxID=3440152 RepID=UPI003EBB91AC